MWYWGIKHKASCMLGVRSTDGTPAPAPGPALSLQDSVAWLHGSEPGPAVGLWMSATL